MTSKNSTSKTVDETTPEAAEAEASVPQQKSGEKVTVLKGGGMDGKDAILVSDGDEEISSMQKFKNLIRNKKVIAGLSAVATLVIVAIVKNALSDPGETEHDEDDFNKAMIMSKALDEGATLAEAQALVSNTTD